MAADLNKPAITDNYSTAYTPGIVGNLQGLAQGLDPAVVTVTNPPTSTIRWSSANNKWQKYNGSTWADLTATYAISISGSAATLTTPRAINGVSFDGSANISVNNNTAVTFNSGGAGGASGITYNGSTAQTVSYNTVGAPSTTGTNASGNWGINVTGSSGSCTGNAVTATTASLLTVNTNTSSNAQYKVLWHSGTTVYEANSITYNPATSVTSFYIASAIQFTAVDATAYSSEAAVINSTDSATAGVSKFGHTTAGTACVTFFVNKGNWYEFGPNTDGTTLLGWALGRWGQIYSSVGTISTSDAREKTPLRDLNTAELAVSVALSRKIGIYQWLKSIEEKGASARLHAGAIAQEVRDIFIAHGLDAFAYGVLCYDSRETCGVAPEDVPDGAPEDRYGLRYDEFNTFVARGLAQRQDELEARIAALEAA